MKYLRTTTTPDPGAAPEVFRLIADSPHVTRARLLGWNVTDALTGLFAIEGDRAAFREALADAPELERADVTPVDEGRFYLLATVRPEAASLATDMFETLTRDGLVIVTPVVYRDGRAHVRLVGTSGAVQAAVENLPPEVDMEVHEIGERGFEPESAAAALSDRQREAVLAAVDLGYYEVPRRATHEGIARRLGCAPSTVSDHLQKAEAKLLRAMAAEIDPSGGDAPP